MSYRGSPGIEAWTLMPVASRTVEVNTKTGFSLTAGSYIVRASSTQRVLGSFNANAQVNSAISSVTVARAFEAVSGAPVAATAIVDSISYAQITTATNVQHNRGGATSTATSAASVVELF